MSAVRLRLWCIGLGVLLAAAPLGCDTAEPTSEARTPDATSDTAIADTSAADAGDTTQAAHDADDDAGVDADAEPNDDADAAVDADTAPEPDADVDADANISLDADAEADADTAVAEDADTAGDPDVGDAADAFEPPAGFGVLQGDCDVLDDELLAASPYLFRSAIDFADDPFDDPEDRERLTEGGLAILEAGNAGGSSLLSEVFAFEVLARCEAATLLATEREIRYAPTHTGPITDFLLEIDGLRVGVSVTRAVAFPFDAPYPVERADALLRDKLADILESTRGVSDDDRWTKQVLFVVAYAAGHVASLETAYAALPTEVQADTIVWIAESRGDDAFLY
jgi:hypothetical protein